VLAQAGRQEVTLTIPAGTLIQRGAERVHLEQLGVGNYVTVQAAPVPSDLDTTLGFDLVPKLRDGDRVGTSTGERPPTLEESSESWPTGRRRGVGPRGGALLVAHGQPPMPRGGPCLSGHDASAGPCPSATTPCAYDHRRKMDLKRRTLVVVIGWRDHDNQGDG
jgi:hypothetical protein